ncbi:MAG: hypothetical protein RMY34_09320 [Aulosira sp. DedQUE10]|nr:hypothetical protein [Aulosira sp. DedQUE10]
MMKSRKALLQHYRFVATESQTVAQTLRVVTVAIQIYTGYYPEPNQPELQTTLIWLLQLP